MQKGNEISEELRELNSPLAGISRDMPYSLPEGYLEKLATSLVEDVKAGESEPARLGLSREMPYAVPEGYFSDLPELLSQGARYADPAASDTLSLEVPAGYFDTLPETLLSAVKSSEKPAEKGRRISLIPLFRKRVIQWAAAAVLLLSVSLGYYQFTEGSSPDAIASKELLQIGGEDLDGYMEQNVDEFDEESLESAIASGKADLPLSLSNLDEQEIENYLDQTGDTNTSTLN